MMTTGGFSLLLLSLFVALQADSFSIAQIAIASAGVGAGLLFPISLTLASDMERTERAYGIKLAAEQLVPAVLLVLISLGAIGAGMDHLLKAVLVVIVICFLIGLAIPPRGQLQDAQGGQGGSLFLSMVSLVALSVSFAGFAGLWVFFERIAAESGYDPEFSRLRQAADQHPR